MKQKRRFDMLDELEKLEKKAENEEFEAGNKRKKRKLISMKKEKLWKLKINLKNLILDRFGNFKPKISLKKCFHERNFVKIFLVLV